MLKWQHCAGESAARSESTLFNTLLALQCNAGCGGGCITVSQGAGRRGGCEQLGVRALGVVGLYLISVCVVLCVLVQERALDVRVM